MIVDVNLNSTCWVKLRPRGMIHLLELHKKVTGKYGDYVPRLDKDGYYRCQLWSFMQEFGETVSEASIPDHFDINIRLEVKDTCQPGEGE